MVTAFHQGRGPLVFITILLPFKGNAQPDLQILTDPKTIMAGMDPVELSVEVEGSKYTLRRDI